MNEPQLRNIDHPGMNDVMCGRGGGTNNHIGNIRFRQLVNGHKLRYLAATKSEKPMVSREVVTIWRSLNPPGRFLKQEASVDGKQGLWCDVGNKKAREKASQCLRERTPDVAPFVKKLELQMTLQEKEENDRKNGVKLEKENGNAMSAAELSRELLHQQQEATLKAHMALEAFVPSSIVHSLSPPMDPNALHPIDDRRPSLTTTNNNYDIPQHTIHDTAPVIAMTNNVGIPMHPIDDRRPSLNLSNDHVVANVPQNQPAPNHSLSERRERLAQEIAQLQKQQAQLEAMARQPRHHMLPNLQSVHPASVSRQRSNGTLPTAADLLYDLGPLNHHNIYNQGKSQGQDTDISYDEYRRSVREFMGSSRSGKSSNSGRSSSRSISTIDNLPNKVKHEEQNTHRKPDTDEQKNHNNHPIGNDVDLHKNSYDRDSEYLENRSQHSWMKAIEDMSMSSGMRSPGSSVKHFLQGDDLEPEPLCFHTDPNDHSNTTLLASNMNDMKKSERSLSSFEQSVLDSMISPTNFSPMNISLPYISEDQNYNTRSGMPPPKSRLPTNRTSGNVGGTNTGAPVPVNSSSSNTISSRPNLSDNKTASNVSMLSDFTDSSLSKKDLGSTSTSRYARLAAHGKEKSDHSMGLSDNVSDLSEAMGSLDMSQK